jgi:hypothetical protein
VNASPAVAVAGLKSEVVNPGSILSQRETHKLCQVSTDGEGRVIGEASR